MPTDKAVTAPSSAFSGPGKPLNTLMMPVAMSTKGFSTVAIIPPISANAADAADSRNLNEPARPCMALFACSSAVPALFSRLSANSWMSPDDDFIRALKDDRPSWPTRALEMNVCSALVSLLKPVCRFSSSCSIGSSSPFTSVTVAPTNCSAVAKRLFPLDRLVNSSPAPPAAIFKLVSKVRRLVPAVDALMPAFASRPSARLTSSSSWPTALATGPTYFSASPRSVTDWLELFAATVRESATSPAVDASIWKAPRADTTMSPIAS